MNKIKINKVDFNTEKKPKRILHKKDSINIQRPSNTFTDTDTNITLLIILLVILVLFWFPLIEKIH